MRRACRPTQVPALLALAFVCVVALHPARVHAQAGGNDYYRAGGTELLHNVELYHEQLARDKLKSRQYQSAWGDVEFMLRFFPNHPRALMMWSELCLKWGPPICQVSNAFEDAIATNPGAAPTYVLYGIHLTRAGNPKGAIDSYNKALELDHDSFNAHYNLGLAYFDAKRYDLSNQHAQRAYALGAPLPGLREKLQKAGKWQPVAASAPAAATSAAPAAVPSATPSAAPSATPAGSRGAAPAAGAEPASNAAAAPRPADRGAARQAPSSTPAAP